MKLLTSYKKWIFTLALFATPLVGISAGPVEDLFARANAKYINNLEVPELDADTRTQIKINLVKFFYDQDIYLSYLAQVQNFNFNGLAPTSYLNQFNEILLAIIANQDALGVYLTNNVGPDYANNFKIAFTNEAGYFLTYNSCVLNGLTGCEDINLNWENDVTNRYADLLSILNPGDRAIIQGYALERQLGQQNEAGFEGWGTTPPTFANAYNSYQIYLVQSLIAGVNMIQAGTIP